MSKNDGRTEETSLDIETQIKKIHELRPLLSQLHSAAVQSFTQAQEQAEAIIAHPSFTGEAKKVRVTASSFGEAIGIGGGRFKQYLDLKAPFTYGTALTNLAQYLGLEELGRHISKTANRIHSKRIILAMVSSDTCDVIVLLLKQYALYCANNPTSPDEFAQLFTPHENIVSGCIRYRKPWIKELDKIKQTREEINSILNANDFKDRVNTLLENLKNERHTASNEYHLITSKLLRDYFVDVQHMVDALGYSSSTHFDILRGQRREDAIKQYTEQAKSLLKQKEDASNAQPIEQPTLHTQPTTDKHTQEEERELPATIPTSLAGSTSILGIEFTLTPGSLIHIDARPSDHFLQTTKQYLQITRALLNVCSQLKDPSVRSDIKDKLELETIELGIALETFKDQFPDMLQEARQARREFVAQQRKTTKKGW